MRIAIDATGLTVPTGGIRRYVVELTLALATHFPDDKVYLYSAQSDSQLPAELQPLPNVKLAVPSWGWLGRKWWSFGLPWEVKRRNIDVFHGADFAIPYLPLLPSVLVIHDLSPWKTGPARSQGAGRIRVRTPYLLRLATMIVTPTQSVRRELSEVFAIPTSKIAAVPMAPTQALQPGCESAVEHLLQRTGLQKPYLLYVGDRKPRKNVRRLVASWRAVKSFRPELGLVLVGEPAEDEVDFDREEGLHVWGPLPDKEIGGLLSGAIAFVYPSLYEGFGLPVLEAMQAGAPVITSHDRAITEVAGEAALQVDVTSTAQLSRAILEVVTNSDLRMRLQQRGIHRASQFSWRSTAILTHAVYVEAIRRF